MKLSEKEIQKQILDYLGHKKIYCWRNNTGSGTHTNPNGQSYFVRYGMKGAADIIGILPGGKFLAIEVKREDGVLTDLQKEFLAQISSRGGVAFVAHSLGEAMETIENL